MTIAKKIVVIWSGAVALMLLSLLLPHRGVSPAAFLINAVQILLLIISVYLVKHEAKHKSKWIFVNFTLMFSVAILFHIYHFVGTLLFASQPMARHYYFQYVSQLLYFLLFGIAIAYVCIDLLFRDFRVVSKYMITLAIVGGYFVYHYHPYLTNPDYLYSTQAINEWRELDRVTSAYRDQFSAEPSPEQLSAFVSEVASPFRFLNETDRLERIRELYPYLEGQNYIILLFRPIYLNAVFMGTLCVSMILLFFGYMYKKDPPQGAYIEKMMFLFLVFCTLEIFHAWTLIKTLEWQSFAQLAVVGLYLSAFVLLCIAAMFYLRLKFITSVKGEFYESELVASPAQVTRWRDALDNLVIAHFSNKRDFFGRMLVNPKYKNS